MVTMEEKEMRLAKLKMMQALPLEEKIIASVQRIKEWLTAFPNAAVSFSGGKDSTVLLHLVRSVDPSVPAVFADTGLEYPEVREFAISMPNVQIVRPRRSFLEVIQKYGYPVISKETARGIKEVQRGDTADKRRRLTGVDKHGIFRYTGMIPKKWQWLCNSALRVSDECCYALKKRPMDKIVSPFVGVMATDSNQRKMAYYRYGCNAFEASRPISKPLSFWLESDIWDYLRAYNVPYSPIYDMGYTRTGCIFCLFGLHIEGRPHRFDRMRETHPKLYAYCMDGPLELRRVIEFVHGEDILRTEAAR